MSEELEIRARVRRTFEQTLAELSLGPVASSDLSAVAELLFEVRESLKRLQKEEASLKAVLAPLMSQSVEVCGDYVVVKDQRSRTDLDKDKLARDLGPRALEPYLRRTDFEVISVRRIE